MGRAALVKALDATGIPFCHMAWPPGAAPGLPWGVYLVEEPDFGADDANYVKVSRFTVELYTRAYDPASEKAVEEAIAPWGRHTKTETWIEQESCMQTAWEFTEIGD